MRYFSSKIDAGNQINFQNTFDKSNNIVNGFRCDSWKLFL